MRLRSRILRCRETNHLHGRGSAGVLQPHIDEIKLEHTQKRVEHRLSNLVWLGAAPYGRKGAKTDQVINATLKPLDLPCDISRLHVHRSGRRTGAAAGGPPLSKFQQKLLRRHEERILLQDTANDDERMRPHDVNHRVASKLSQMISADDRVVMTAPHVVDTRLKLNHVVDPGSIFHRPVHAATDATHRKSVLGVSTGQLLKDLQHPILIETAIRKVNLCVDPQLQLPTLLSCERVDARGGQALYMIVTLRRV